MRPLSDAEVRDQIASRLDVNMMVEAAAGTGKTSELVRRIVAVLEQGLAEVDRLVAVTFTEKAAGELKLRLREKLEEALRRATEDSPVRAHLERALAHLEDARISTIHGFCADLLRERPVEARVDPAFEVVTEQESERLYGEAFSLWLQQQLDDPPEGIRRSLRRQAGSEADETATARLRKAGWTLAAWRDLGASWRREPFDRQRRIDALVEQLHGFADLTRACTDPRDTFYRGTWQARRTSDEIRSVESVRSREYDGLEAALVALAQDSKFRGPSRGWESNWRAGVTRAQAHAAHAQLVAALIEFKRAADADLAALLQTELAGSIERYEEIKRRTGRLDFLDLLLKARDLIHDCHQVRAEFQRRFVRIFVDEFQDTDPLQAEILLLLAAADPSVSDWRDATPAPGKLFIVGDPKQSIYRFRRADVGVYQGVRTLLGTRGAVCLELTTSFRAVPSIQNFVNGAFGSVMDNDPIRLQARYVALAPYRIEPPAQPSIVALPVPAPYGQRNITNTAIEQSLPGAVGAFVDWLLHRSGWTVTERERPDARVPVSARHVCILFRRFESFYKGDMTRAYVKALEARGIPHLLVGGRSFHEREEVGTLRSALSAIEWPDVELFVFSALRGSLFSIGDEELLEYRDTFGRLNPFRIPEESLPPHLNPIAEALGLLRSLHGSRNYRPVAETIGRLLEATRAHAGFALRPSGEQALANVLQIAELARSYEASGGISFRGFVAQLQDDAENGKTSDAPILEEGSDGVRIMTVHKAKGLEFPVVILADLTTKPAPAEPSRHIDAGRGLCAVRIAGWSPAELIDQEAIEREREQAESVRIAYVAATRARDLLVIPAIGDAPYMNGWLSPLNPALYPPLGRARRPEKASGCPTFGTDSVLSRPHEDLPTASVCPGLHRFGRLLHPADVPDESYGVVWWDPLSLNLDAPPSFGIRQEKLIAKDVDPATVDADLSAHSSWRAGCQLAIERGSAPSVRIATATEVAADVDLTAVVGSDPARAAAVVPSRRPSEALEEVELIELPREAAGPAGARYGTLVHAVLAAVPLDADATAIARVVAQQGRILGATSDELSAACRSVQSVLEHPILGRARTAFERGHCRRETPITLMENERLVEGVVDLAFLEADTWRVVDFKTDREIDRRRDRYLRQVGLYARAIARATGQPATAVVIMI